MKKRTTGELEEKIILDYIKRLEKKGPIKRGKEVWTTLLITYEEK